jgi:O-methyltransferase
MHAFKRLVDGSKLTLQKSFRRLGFEIASHRELGIPPRDARIIQAVTPYTLTNPKRLMALLDSVTYIVDAGLEGAVVECGVWKGGSMMCAAMALHELQDENRDFYLFDTFEFDVTYAPDSADGQRAATAFARASKVSEGERRETILRNTKDVEGRLHRTGYPASNVHLVAGRVEDTLPQRAPGRISLLRLDTDLYQPTLHQLTCLFPRLEQGGVLIIDDYDDPTWPGVRKAVDEYLESNNVRLLLHRVDSGSRMAVKSQSSFTP